MGHAWKHQAGNVDVCVLCGAKRINRLSGYVYEWRDGYRRDAAPTCKAPGGRSIVDRVREALDD